MELLEALERWRAVRERAPGTFLAYRYALLRMAAFGLHRVEDVTPQLVAAWVFRRSRSVAPQTTKAELAALTAPLSVLERAGEFPTELLRAVRRQAPELKKPARFRARHLDRVAFETLRSGAARDRTRFAIGVCTLSGLRAGELARSRWEDWTLDAAPAVRVRIVPELGQHGRIKTGQERTVPVCAELAGLLRARAESSGYLFRQGSKATVNAHATVKTLRRDLVLAREAVELPWVTFHILRHTRASWWVQAGVSLPKIAYWLGNSLEVCERYYAALRDGYDPDCERMPA